MLSGEEMAFLREALTAIARRIMDVEIQRKTGGACEQESDYPLLS